MKMPLVSIVVPVYNTGVTLFDTIKSIQRQTYKNIETIIVNDGSTDQKTVEKLAKIDKVIKVIEQENKGLPAARNAGIAASNGEYIICLDSDDCINRHYVEKLIKRFYLTSDLDVAIVSSYVQAFGASNEQWEIPDFDKEKIKYSNVLAVASMFTKKAWQSIGGYDESFKKGFEDWDFWLSLVEKGYKWSVVKEPLFYYRRKQNSMITSSNKSRDEINLNIIKKHGSLYGDENIESIMDKMKETELLKNNSSKSFAYYMKKIFSRNALKRFRIFR